MTKLDDFKDQQAKRHFDEKLGLYLKEKREACGLSQKEISETAGLKTSQFVSNIERGLCPVPNHLLRIMIEKYRININDFLVYLSELKMDYYKQALRSPKQKISKSSRSL